MAHEKNHDFHIISPSFWPLLTALSVFIMLFGAVQFMHETSLRWMLYLGFGMVLVCMFLWWKDVILEGSAGDHTPVVQIGIRYGVIMFIISEVMFFVAWFWSFFKHAFFPMSDQYPAVDGAWPPAGIETLDAWHLPLINTLILLLSGCAVTWAHHALVHDNDRKSLIQGLTIAIILGACFTLLQAYEYSHAQFAFSGNIYGALFYMATGFHGFHVIIGTIFLAVCLLRAMNGDFTPEHHLGFEAAAWYWHFVDVVWLFLFSAVYIWGG